VSFGGQFTCRLTIRSIYEFIKVNRGAFSVQAMCRLLDVAPSGYYAWIKKLVSNRIQEDARLLRLIRASFTAGQGIYGAPRVFLDLREAGETCSKHRVALKSEVGPGSERRPGCGKYGEQERKHAAIYHPRKISCGRTETRRIPSGSSFGEGQTNRFRQWTPRLWKPRETSSKPRFI
jgi:hypothetical protein